MTAETTTLTLPVVVPNTLPAEIVALSPELLAEAGRLVGEAMAMTPSDAASLDRANDLFRKVDKLAKTIADGRLEVTRPIDALKKKIIAAEEQATKPLAEAKTALGARITACARELQRQREEIERKAREEAEAKARAERERLEAERQAKIKADREEHERQTKAAEEEARLFGTEAEEIAPPAPPPPVVVVPEVVLPPEAQLPIKSAARTTTRQKLVIDEPKLIPVELGGVRLLVPDEKAITAMLKAGVQIPGCRLEAVTSIGATGR